MEIKRLIPKDKMDIESVNKLKALDINLFKPIIPDLLEWTADANWPTTKEIGKLLLPLGRELVPHLRKIFASDDDCWKYSILVKLVINLPKSVLSEMEADLKRLAFNPTEREKQELVDEEAADILSLLYQT
ncbi:DUF5071 domain-containing protein [Paenibacillus sp. FSL H8-0261]|uniref:DUF5071 domain-containing protein n=1 Tax=Paenibacillus sp. FSL H8-0261 TaxID=2921381 RepID=UPI003252B604